MSTLLTDDLTCTLQAFERNRYFYGKLMTVRDFEQEQRYLNGKRWLINQLLFGSGTVCGLEVLASVASSIRLKTGVALDPCGREIIVPEEREYDLNDLTDENGNKIGPTSGTVRICLSYAECAREPVPALKATTCEEVCDYNRIRESFQLHWRPVPPPPAADDLTFCETWLGRKKIQASSAQVSAERTAPVWVRPGAVFEVAVKVSALQDLASVRLTENVAGGTLIEPNPTPPTQFPTPPIPLRSGEFFVYVYQIRAGAGPGPVTINIQLTGATSPVLQSTVQVVSNAEAEQQDELADHWLTECEVPGEHCVDIAEVTLLFTGNSISSIDNINNIAPRRFVYSLGQIGQLLDCVQTSLFGAPGSSRPGHAFITLKDLESANPSAIGTTAAPGTAFTASRGDHAHALPLAPSSGLEFTSAQLRINGLVGGPSIDFANPVLGQTPVQARHLVTKEYVDSKVAGLDWQESVLDKDLSAPPANPPAGARYLLFAANPSGAWNGRHNDIAMREGNSWTFTTPNEGTAVFVEDENRAYIFVEGAWTEFLASPQIIAGGGLVRAGNELSVGQGAGVVVNADDVTVAFERGDPLPVGLASPGAADTVSRGDHVHGLPDLMATGLVRFERIFPGQIATSGFIDPGLRIGNGPIAVLLGVEIDNEISRPIFTGVLFNVRDPRVQVQLTAEIDQRTEQFQIHLTSQIDDSIATIRVRWWAFRPMQDRGEIVVGPRPTLTFPTLTIPTLTIPTLTFPTIDTLTLPTFTLPTFIPTIITPTLSPTFTLPTIIPTIITPTLSPTFTLPTVTATLIPTVIQPTLTATIIPTIIAPTLPGPTLVPTNVLGTQPIATLAPTLVVPTTVAPTVITPGGIGGVIDTGGLTPGGIGGVIGGIAPGGIGGLVIPRETVDRPPSGIPLEKLTGISPSAGKKLVEAGIPDVEALARATPKKIASVLGRTEARAKTLIDSAKRLLESQ
jgi:hypothetical protein